MRLAVRALKRQYPDLDRVTLLALVRALWSRPVFERRMTAVLVLDSFSVKLRAADVGLIERLLRESKTWALVDELAIEIAGSLVERTPSLVTVLDRWAVHEDFWLRRSAMLALLPPLRRGAGDFVRFAGYADAMLEEREFFIRKAIGWVLRETSKRRPQLIYDWIRPRARRASGVTVREAVKYLSERQREAVWRAFRSGRSPTVSAL